MKNKAKVITMCGSLRFQNEFIKESERLELAGNCVLSVVYPAKEKNDYTEDEIQMLGKMHFQKIEMSDGIYVVNFDGYVGESTRNEIEYARKMGKEILSLEPLT